MNQKQIILEALSKGKAITNKQFTARYNIACPRKVISMLRFEGYPIYLNKHVDKQGRKTNKYYLGNPSRRLVDSLYQAMVYLLLHVR